MIPIRYGPYDAIVRVASTGALALLMACQVVAQGPNPMNNVELRPGVIIDAARKQIYAMSPDGGLEAIDLEQGDRVWATKAVARPLAVTGDRLVGQAETSAAPNTLNVVTLNPANGQTVMSAALGMPAGVQASVVQTPKSNFVAAARVADAEAVIDWTFTEAPKRGIPPFAVEALDPTGPEALAPAAPAAPSRTSGSYRLNLATGASSVAPAPARPVLAAPTAASVNAPERVPNVAADAEQFLSSDGKHIMISRESGDDAAWDRYTLTVFEKGTNRRVGEFKSHMALMPFFVDGAKVIFETTPYERQAPAGLVSEPAKLRAYSLETGKEIWSRAVREAVYRGPSPP